MRKRLIRGMVAGAAGMLLFAMGTVNAAVSVTIDNADGSTVYSLPALPENQSYPNELPRRVTGTAGFDSNEGGVLLQFIDDNGNTQYSGDATLSCNETFSCTWSFTIPFFFAGHYDLVATASQPNPSDPDNPITQTATIEVNIL